jgi:hypothetical protein
MSRTNGESNFSGSVHASFLTLYHSGTGMAVWNGNFNVDTECEQDNTKEWLVPRAGNDSSTFSDCFETEMLIGAASEAATFRLPLARNHCPTPTSISATGDSYHDSNHRTDNALSKPKTGENSQEKRLGW